MGPSAHDVAAVLRERLPGLPTKKLHKLLYYCQGHHLATFDEPLFSETISAWDIGPVVGTLWHEEGRGSVPPACTELTEAQLNTIGYVLSRYGALSGRELEILTHSEMPWQRANSTRRPSTSTRIRSEWIKDQFKASDVEDGTEDEALLDSEAVTQWLEGAQERRSETLCKDDPETILARLARSA
jgi:uncharacterized phage-associated protein